NPGDFLNIPLLKNPGPAIFLRDVATVEDASDVTVGYALINGKRSVYIPVTKTADASTMSVVGALERKLPEMQALLPDYVQLKYEFDQSVYVIEAVRSLASEGILGALLTGLMVFLFLRDLRSSLVVICTIPISVMAAVMLLKAFGQTINIMTLSGLALAIGILVDQATVAIENIHQHLEMGKTKSRAIADASQEVSFPLLLITICILAVFAPAFLMSGVPKGMFLPLSLSVGFSMIASYLLSQTFVPVITNWWLKDFREIKKDHTAARNMSGFERFKLLYLSLIDKALSKPKRTISIYLLVSFGIMIFCFTTIGKDLMPKVEHSHQFQLRLVGPDGLRIERMEEGVIQVIGLIKEIVGEANVDITSSFVGMTPSSYGTNALYIFTSGPQEAILQVNLNEDYKIQSLDVLKDQIRKKAKAQIPKIKLSFEPIELTDKILSQGANTPIEVLVASKNLDEARIHANKIKTALEKVEFLRDVRINQPLNYPSTLITIDREKAAQFTLTANGIAKSLVAATSSSRFTAKNLWLDSKKGFAYQVQVQVPEYQMKSNEDIERIPLLKGQMRPTISDVAEIKSRRIPAEYDRIGPRRIVTVSANLYKKDLGSAADVVNRAMKDAGATPKGLVVELRGLAKLLQDTLQNLQSGLLLAIIVIFLLLSANYQSFKVAFVVLVTVPAVLSGSLVLLIITGGTLNLQSYMGIIMSVGVSVANAVLLVTNAEALRVKNGDALQAARTAGALRLRPILMTSIAMVAGMVPMASGFSESGEQAAPLGRAVIGGLVASTFAALVILPVVFMVVQKSTATDSVSLNPDDRNSPYYDLGHDTDSEENINR
ncbi:MAG TPA: efflux RND transporter permease subunit, partial [Cyclobacteriaceae bacterium]|nr:efflux RND transporter permease subunit [Cyclobacteriaceae bacterium]